MKKNFLLPEGYLEPSDYRTVREAIGGLNPVHAGVADPGDPMHKSAAHKRARLKCLSKSRMMEEIGRRV